MSSSDNLNKTVPLCDSVKRYRMLFENMVTGFILGDMIYDDKGIPSDFRILELNPTAEKMFFVRAKDSVGKTAKTVWPNIEPYWIEAFGKVSLTGESMEYGNYIEHVNKYYNSWIYSTAKDQFAVIFVDLTEHKLNEKQALIDGKRLNYLLKFNSMLEEPESAIFDFTLQAVLELTESIYGYIYFYSEETKLFTLYSWSSDVMPNCRIRDQATVYELDKTGIWGEAVRQRKTIIVNDFEKPNPLKKGYPEGHVKLSRFMTSPSFDGGKIVAVVGVANKKTPYTQFDENQLQMMIQGMWLIIQRKRVIAELKVKEKHFRNTIENMNELLIQCKTSGEIVMINPAAFRLLGYSNEQEIIGKNIANDLWVIPHEYENIKELLSETQIVRDFRVMFKHKNKSHRAFEGSVRQVRNEDGTPGVIEFVMKDVTDRIRAEEELQQQAKLNAFEADIGLKLTENCPTSEILQKCTESIVKHLKVAFARIWTLNHEENVLELKASAGLYAHLNGIHSRIPVGKYRIGTIAEAGKPYLTNSVYNDHPDCDREWAVSNGIEAFAGYPLIVENRVEGVLAIFSQYLIPDSTLSILLTVSHAIAQTVARHRMIVTLRKLSQAVEQSPAAVVISNKDGTIDYVNPKFSAITGYTPQDFRGQNPRFIKSGVHSQDFYKKLWDTILSGQEWHGEFCNKKKNGELYWESASISPIRNEYGDITHFVAIKEDITERKQLNEALTRAKEEAETANRAKSLFLANMSHEIRTPMNAILGFSQLMLRDAAMSSSQRKRLETIKMSGEHLLALIDDILEISKIEAGRATFNPSTFDLFALLKEIEAMFRLRTDAKQLRFRVDIPKNTLRYVITDEGKLRQILINLLGNAVKFTEAGTIELRIHVQPTGNSGFRLIAEVEDTGIGIAPNELCLLFQSFQQTASGIKRGGTGLGLAISREFARLMGGDITVTSELYKGSCFRVEIELKEGGRTEKPESHGNVIGLHKDQEPVRVLIVDDIAENRALVREMLTPLGFQTLEATNGEEAITLFGSWSPHVILMDMRMPVMNGYEATERIKTTEKGQHTPIIAITASAFNEDRQKALNMGVQGYLRKPFKAEELLEEIGNCTDIKYVYDSCLHENRSLNTPVSKDISGQSLANLPAELVTQMKVATINGDFDLLLDIIGQVKTYNRSLAEGLEILAEQFDSERLLDLFLKGEKST